MTLTGGREDHITLHYIISPFHFACPTPLVRVKGKPNFLQLSSIKSAQYLSSTQLVMKRKREEEKGLVGVTLVQVKLEWKERKVNGKLCKILEWFSGFTG